MRVLALLAMLALLLAGCSGAQDGAEPPTGVEPAAGKGAISGLVVDEAIRPLYGATVALVGTDETQETDLDGIFRWTDLEPGSHFITVSGAGYESQQVAAEVVAGETAHVRVQLLLDDSPLPFAQTFKLDGHMQAWGGIGQFVLEEFLPDGSGLCNCRLTVEPTGNVTSFVVEAFWDPTTPDPAELNEFYLAVDESGEDGFSEAVYCFNPCNLRLDAGAIGYGGGQVTARLDGADLWPGYQQSFKLFVTVFYNAPAPAGWSIANDA